MLKDQAIADRALGDMPEAYRHLDTAVLEALILKGAARPDRGRHLPPQGPGLQPQRRRGAAARALGDYDAAFFLRSTPVAQVRAIAAAGVNMPPKSTYFFPKVPTGLLFNPLL